MSVLALIAGAQIPKVISRDLLREIKEVYKEAYEALSSLELESESPFLKESFDIIAEFVPDFESI